MLTIQIKTASIYVRIWKVYVMLQCNDSKSGSMLREKGHGYELSSIKAKVMNQDSGKARMIYSTSILQLIFH
jgi:hypothetical protein